MPWKSMSIMENRREFVRLALLGDVSVAELCRRYGISRQTGFACLHRHGLLDPRGAAKHAPFQRFEREVPNDLWQMDFKGHVATGQGRCHPLTMLDDHSRYSLTLQACASETLSTVQGHVTQVFRRYGLPRAILAANGSPWGSAGGNYHTAFEVWLMRLGIRLLHGRAYHPQTQGKEERFHRTLNVEVLQGCLFADLAACQLAKLDLKEQTAHITTVRYVSERTSAMSPV